MVVYVKPVLAVDTFDPGNPDGTKYTIRGLMDKYPDIRQYKYVRQRIRQDGSVISPVIFDQLSFHYIKGKWYWKEGYLPEDWCLTESKVICPK